MMATQQWGSHVPRARPKVKPKGYASGGPVDPGGKTISNVESDRMSNDFLDRGDTFEARMRVGGTPDERFNKTSTDPDKERHLRKMESLSAVQSRAENELSEMTGEDPYKQKRFSHPDDAARYHGFAKGGAVKKVFEGTKKDLAQDKAGAKKMGVSMKAYERTPKDKAQDKAGQRQMFGKRK
jgi:hypothetical protein